MLDILRLRNEIKKSNIKNFILGGSAEFTIYQEAKDGKEAQQAHYKVTISKERNCYFVRVNNVYQGCIYKKKPYSLYTKGAKGKDTKATRALLWVLNHQGDYPDEVHVLHMGRCACCGRKLSDPLSIELGIGPTCRARREGK